MKLSEPQRDILKEHASVKCDEMSAIISIRSMIPYDITNPGGDAAIQRVSLSVDEADVDLDIGSSNKISERSYKNLFRVVTAVEQLIADGSSRIIGDTSLDEFQTNIVRARNTIAHLMEIKSAGMKDAAVQLQSKYITRATKRYLDQFVKAGMKEVSGEAFFEDQEANLYESNKNRMKGVMGELKACEAMIDVLDNLSGMIREHQKSMPLRGLE